MAVPLTSALLCRPIADHGSVKRGEEEPIRCDPSGVRRPPGGNRRREQAAEDRGFGRAGPASPGAGKDHPGKGGGAGGGAQKVSAIRNNL